MRAYLPIILVLLAVFTAACIAYVAWELSSGDRAPPADEDAADNAGAERPEQPDS